MINQRIFSANVGDSSVGIAGPDAIEQDIDNLLANDQELEEQINDLDAEVYLKANKLQEDWISPALLNGWVNASAGREPKFYKDDFGQVHLAGAVTSGVTTANTTIFTLPVGYRPAITRTFIVRTSSNAVFGVISIAPSGNVNIGVADASLTGLDGIMFRARDKMEQLQTEHGVFTNNEITGRTAEEVYQEWLANRDKPPLPTKEELFEQELANTNALILELTELIIGGM